MSDTPTARERAGDIFGGIACNLSPGKLAEVMNRIERAITTAAREATEREREFACRDLAGIKSQLLNLAHRIGIARLPMEIRERIEEIANAIREGSTPS